MLRVLLITNMFPRSESPHSGIFVKNEVEAVQRLFAHVTYEFLVIRGYESRLNYLRGIFELRARLAGGFYDLIHAHHGYSCLVAALARSSIPVVATFHGSDVNDWRQFPFTRLASRFADRIIVVNPDFAKRFPRKKVVVLRPGVDTDAFQPIPTADAREALGLETTPRYLLFGGAPSRPVKNYPLFQEVLKRVRSRYQGEVRELILEGKTQSEVQLALCAADVLLFTSVSEGSPQVVKEAMCCNLPIVSVDVGDVRETIDGANLCYVCPTDPQALADRILLILESGQRSNGRGNVIGSDLELSAVARKLVEIYEGTTGASSPGCMLEPTGV